MMELGNKSNFDERDMKLLDHTKEVVFGRDGALQNPKDRSVEIGDEI